MLLRPQEIEQTPLRTVWEVGVPFEAHAYAHLKDEVRGVLSLVKNLLVDGVPSQDIVLVARDDAGYGPTVLEVAREYGVSVQALYQVSVADTRVGFWLRLLFEALTEGFPLETTARVLMHPLGPGMLDLQWARSGKVRPREAKAWKEIGADLSLLAWPDEDTRALWLERFDTLLEAHALKNKVASWPREVLALANLKEATEWLGDPAEETISREHFLWELEETLRTATSPAHP